jgi:membrane-bound ClpP family serine protease
MQWTEGSPKCRTNVLLFVETFGGSADAAYRMARCLTNRYEKFIVYIDNYCKSAGTLPVLAADEVVMSDSGELGPLDVQVIKPEELGEMSSGLAPLQALNTLRVQAFSFFEYSFLQLRARSQRQITTKSAAEIASTMTIGLFAPIYQQLDPMRLGKSPEPSGTPLC